jgi:hypothetical protein
VKSNAKDARSVDELVAAIASGVRPKYVFFWGHTPSIPGRIDASCLSNWYPAAFSLKGVEYATTEHYMMAEKAKLFGDEEMRQRILAADGPGAAKSLGRKVAGFDEETWTKHRFEIVVAGNLAKFGQHEQLGEYLRTTGTKVLVEASPRDRFWGIGMGKTNAQVENPSQWKGLNLLGFALMEVRQRLFG